MEGQVEAGVGQSLEEDPQAHNRIDVRLDFW